MAKFRGVAVARIPSIHEIVDQKHYNKIICPKFFMRVKFCRLTILKI